MSACSGNQLLGHRPCFWGEGRASAAAPAEEGKPEQRQTQPSSLGSTSLPKLHDAKMQVVTSYKLPVQRTWGLKSWQNEHSNIVMM